MSYDRKTARQINEEERPWVLLLVERLKLLREERGLTQIEVARRSGIHRVNICRMESGHHCPNIENIMRVCEALEVPPSAVFEVLDQYRPPSRNQNP